MLQMTCGTVYGVVPFVSRRSNGVVCGLVSAGGATGGVLWQAIFFLKVTTAGNGASPRLFLSLSFFGYLHLACESATSHTLAAH